MYPILFSFNTPEFLQGFMPSQIHVYSYGFFIALGIMASFLYTNWKVKKFGVSSDTLSGLFLWIILAAFVGGRLFFFFEDFDKYLAQPSLMLRLGGGGFVFYGSLLFVVPTMIIWLRKNKVPVRPFFDIVAFAGPIIHSIGRLGCFMAGCCYGIECDNSLGVVFNHPDSLAHPLHTPLYPTQLFDVLINIIIIVVLIIVSKRKYFAGQLFLMYIVLYAIGRSINEIYRGDEARGFLFGGALSHSQFIAICLLLIASYMWWRWRNRPEEQL